MVRTVSAAWAACFWAASVFAAEAVADLPFSYDAPLIAPYWNRELKKVEADEAARALVEVCTADYRHVKPDWKLLHDATYQSADASLTYFDFQAEGVSDFRIVYVYSNLERRFLGKFPGSRA